jgi:hypothetical protein
MRGHWRMGSSKLENIIERVRLLDPAQAEELEAEVRRLSLDQVERDNLRKAEMFAVYADFLFDYLRKNKLIPRDANRELGWLIQVLIGHHRSLARFAEWAGTFENDEWNRVLEYYRRGL